MDLVLTPLTYHWNAGGSHKHYPHLHLISHLPYPTPSGPGRTKGAAELLRDGLAGREAVRGCKEGVEAAVKVDQRARVGAASLAREQRVALAKACSH